MIRGINFDRFHGEGWPLLRDLEPYFIAPKGKEWFFGTGNDSAGIYILGINGTQQLPYGRGRIDIKLSLWGDPKLGVLVIYRKYGSPEIEETYTSKGDLDRLNEYVRTLHNDPMPVGLYIPYAQAWKAVKEFMETDGALPKSIEWIANTDLPANTFPDP